MSEVFARNRTETKLQFFVNALELQKELSIYVMRDKIVHKKWRYAVSYPLIEKVDELVDNITYANSIYPTTERELETRKHYQTMAIANCFQIQNKLVRMEKCIDPVKIEQMEKFVNLIGHEIELLKAWKKANKIIKE